MKEVKNENDVNVPETDIPNTILTPMNVIDDDVKKCGLVERFYELFYNLLKKF